MKQQQQQRKISHWKITPRMIFMCSRLLCISQIVNIKKKINIFSSTRTRLLKFQRNEVNNDNNEWKKKMSITTTIDGNSLNSKNVIEKFSFFVVNKRSLLFSTSFHICRKWFANESKRTSNNFRCREPLCYAHCLALPMDRKLYPRKHLRLPGFPFGKVYIFRWWLLLARSYYSYTERSLGNNNTNRPSFFCHCV